MRIVAEQDIIRLKKEGKSVKLGKRPVVDKVEKMEAVEPDKMLEAVQGNGQVIEKGFDKVAESVNKNAEEIKALGEKITMLKREPEEKEEKTKVWSCTVQRDRKGMINGLRLEGV